MMSLVPDYENSSDSDEFSSDADTENEHSSDEKDDTNFSSQCKLPAPKFGEETESPEDTKSSVFKNPFIEAENAKAAILQKHVKMVETKDNIVVINGKKICWNYRKGRCRFGHNCKFAHDSDIQKTAEQIEVEKLAVFQNAVVCQNNQIGLSGSTLQKTGSDVETVEDCPSQSNKKRKRPGLTQGLIPGKKVLKQYLKNQKI
ncbi:uncharacterized protein [Leptinotarsa decemlineata]|uniref:uncharacterized protein n=1 Tax=Leptinotarsa decemlineata TaxID=7539 RepID=UPI000C2558C0|nr:uncharacterized protein LOC111506077 [Leptinotarsa decemlineata]